MSLHSDSSAIRKHLAIAQESAAPTLIAKRCACGKAAFARQLAQHGRCVACQLADRVATLAPGDLDKLKHALGAVSNQPKRDWGFRNYYNACSEDPAMLRLVAAGFMSRGRVIEADSAYFHATRIGCKVAGLSGARIGRAMGDQA